MRYAWLLQNKDTGKFVSRKETYYTEDLMKARLYQTRKEARAERYDEVVRKVKIEFLLID